MRSALYWLIAHAQAVVTALAAVAAMFSALSSLLIWRVQRQNLLETMRPELTLFNWGRVTQGDIPSNNSRAVVLFAKIKNVGRGAAFNVWLRVDRPQDGPYSMGTIRLPIIAANEELSLADSRIVVWFKDAAVKAVRVPLIVSSSDSRGNVYTVVHDLLVVRGDIPFAGSTIADNVDVTRKSTMTPAWRLRLRARRNRLLLKLIDLWRRLQSKLP